MRKEVEFVRCLGHGVKMHVLLAQWTVSSVVLKTSEPATNYSVVARHLQWHSDHHRLISRQEFVREVS